MTDRTQTILEAGGIALLVIGVALLSVPAAFIIAGAALVGLGNIPRQKGKR